MHDRQDLYAFRLGALHDTVRKTENPAAADVAFNNPVEHRRLLNPTDRIEYGQGKAPSETGTLGLIILCRLYDPSSDIDA